MNENNDTNSPTQFEKLAAAGEKAALYMRTTEDFGHWVTDNITRVDVKNVLVSLKII